MERGSVDLFCFVWDYFVCPGICCASCLARSVHDIDDTSGPSAIPAIKFSKRLLDAYACDEFKTQN